MISYQRSLFLFMGIVNGFAIVYGSMDSILNSKGVFGDSLSSKTVQGADNPLEGLHKTLNDPVKLHKMYSKYRSAFGRVDSESDHSRQKIIFKANLVKIASHNVNARAGKESYEMGVNNFTDMTFSEVVSKFTGYRRSNSSAKLHPIVHPAPVAFMSKRDSPPPNAVDWRQYGLVTSVKNQGQCGSCVLFSTTACLESYYALTHGQWNGQLDLSEQELLDCDNGAKYPDNHGCGGNGFPETFQYLQSIGQSLESDYPYVAQQGSCRASSKSHPAKVENYWSVAANDENALKTAVGKWGPVSVALCVSDSWQHYSSGVYTGPCPDSRNHAVLAVGYGNENGQDYWILKNQWGDTWGDQGFIKHGRNMNNLCDIAGDAVSCNSNVEIAIG